jgi:subtilase family serine protease
VVVFNEPVGTIIQDVAVPDGFSCGSFENPVNQVVCTGSVGSGQTQTFTIHVYKTNDGTSNSNAVVDPNNTIVESNEANNTDHGTV